VLIYQCGRRQAPVGPALGRRTPAQPLLPSTKEDIMDHQRRTFAAVTALACGVLVLATAPAAFAMPLPPPDCCDSGASGAVTLIAGGGMPGWQIALIAVGAALAAAVLAVLLDRARAARKNRLSTA
jgi:hypothetical protein